MFRFIFSALVFCLCVQAQGTRPYLLDTFAGHYPTGDGGVATDALLKTPLGVVAGGGRLYISDNGNGRIRLVTPDGKITTLLDDRYARGMALDAQGNLYFGQGYRAYRMTASGEVTVFAGSKNGFDGDGGPATSAKLEDAWGFAVGPDGSVFIADRRNNRIRRVTPDGTINSFAGNGTAGFSGDGGAATQAQLNGPVGLAADGTGNVYIIDQMNYRVRKVTPDGKISTVAGNGTYAAPVDGAVATESPLTAPSGIAVEASGNLYITDLLSDRVLRVDAGGILHVFAGSGRYGFSGDGGPAINADLNGPSHVTTDGDGNVYFSDSANQRIRRVDASGTISTFAGRSHFSGDGGPATGAVLFDPSTVASDNQGNIYVADKSNLRVRKVALDGTISTVAGNGKWGPTGDGGPATEAKIAPPRALLIDPQGHLYIGSSRQVRRVEADGTIQIFAGTGVSGDSGDGGPAAKATFRNVQGLAYGPDGSVYVADSGAHRVRRVASDGTIYAFAGTGQPGFAGDGGPAVQALLNYPRGAAVGTGGSVYITDSQNGRLRKVSPSGIITTVAGNGSLNWPQEGALAIASPFPSAFGVTIDAAGDVIVGTWLVVYKLTSQGRIYRIAGQHESGFGGDGGLATDGKLNGAWGVAVNPDGDILVSDMRNDRIRRLRPDHAVRLEAVVAGKHSGLVGQPLGDPLRLRVIGALGLPLPRELVTFAVTSGNATIATPNVMTDAAGVASALVTLGAVPGDAVVTATVPGVPDLAFEISSFADPNGMAALPGVSAGGVVGAGLSVPPVRSVSPAGIVSIFGTAFAPPGTMRQVGGADLVGGRLPTRLDHVCVEMGAKQAYMLHIFPNQINVQVPHLTAGEEVAVRVVRNCGLAEEVKSEPRMVMVQAATPEFFYWKQNADGHNPIAAVNPVSHEFVGPPGLISGVTLVKAMPGDTIDFYATGFGKTSPVVPPGDIPGYLATTVARPVVTVGGTTVPDADVLYSGVTPWAGVYLLRIKVPPVGSGNHAVTVRIGSETSAPGGYLTVGQ